MADEVTRKPGWYRVRTRHGPWMLAEWTDKGIMTDWAWYSTVGTVMDGTYWAEIDERPIPVEEHPWDRVRRVVGYVKEEAHDEMTSHEKGVGHACDEIMRRLGERER